MDPFRDELAAAHAKIAKLESDKRELEEKLRERTAPPQRSASGGPAMLAIMGFAVMGIILGLVATFVVRGRAAASSTDFRGIATAEEDRPNQIPPMVDPRPTSTATPTDSAATRKKENAKCNCTPGDPLCTCL